MDKKLLRKYSKLSYIQYITMNLYNNKYKNILLDIVSVMHAFYMVEIIVETREGFEPTNPRLRGRQHNH